VNDKDICFQCKGKGERFFGGEWIRCPSCDGKGLRNEKSKALVKSAKLEILEVE